MVFDVISFHVLSSIRHLERTTLNLPTGFIGFNQNLSQIISMQFGCV